MFRAIISSDLASVGQLPTMSRRLREQRHEAGAILAMHHFFAQHQLQSHAEGHVVLAVLEDFVWYAQSVSFYANGDSSAHTALIIRLPTPDMPRHSALAHY